MAAGTGLYFYISGNSTYNQTNAGEAGIPEERQVTVRSVKPETGALTVVRNFTGEISAVDQADIYSEAPGRLRRYTFSEGDEVKKNDILALIDREVTGMDFEPIGIRSPIEGVVTRLYPGIGGTVTTQNPVVTVANLSQMKVSFSIPEKDLGFVDRGNRAILRVTARPGVIFEGKVVRISQSLDSLSRTAYAEAFFDNPERVLLPGMFGELEVIVRNIQDALLIPIDAALRSHDKNGMHVYINENGTAVKKDITAGYSEGGNIQIAAGLSPADKVIVEGQYFLEDGDKVREAE